MRFSFIHAADLHIDSPLLGLSLKDAAVAQRFALAGRQAVEALIEQTIACDARFLILAGDIFDGDWKDVSTGLFFVRALGALHRAGIPVFMVKGNHDAESVMSRDLPYPDTVRAFRSAKAETFALDDCRVALHGRSFPHRLTADFVDSYPQRRDGWLNIGVLHTSLDGTRGHQGYAPCSVDDLRRFGYDYWALGHVHAAEIISREPWIVYPGNLQGRSVRETGPKGAMRVTVEDGRVVEVTPLVLDGARWAHLEIDLTGISDDTALQVRLHDALAASHAQCDGRPLAARLTLTGTTPLHNHLIAKRDTLQDELRAFGFQLASDCWVEQLKVRTAPPPRPVLQGTDALDVSALLAEVAADPEFAVTIGELLETVKAKLPKDLHDALATPELTQRLAQDAAALLAGELS